MSDHTVDDLLADGEAEADASVGLRHARSEEPLEDLAALLLGYAKAFIANTDDRVVFLATDLDRDGAALGAVLHGIAQEVLRSEEHTSELQSRQYLVCRLLLEKKKKKKNIY